MNTGRAFGGIVLVVLGAILIADKAGNLNAGEVLKEWWPLALVLAACLMAATKPHALVGPTVLGLIGLALLSRTTGFSDNTWWRYVGPTAIVLLGLLLLFGHGRGPADIDDRVNTFVAFGGNSLASRSTAFSGGSIASLFGGTELDLRQAQLAPQARIDAFTAFGAIEIVVPEGWRVQVRGLPLFGGIDNATTRDEILADAPSLDIGALVLFGGLEIKH